MGGGGLTEGVLAPGVGACGLGGASGVEDVAGVVAGSDQVLVGAAVAVEESVSVGVGLRVGAWLKVGVGVGVGAGGSVGDAVGGGGGTGGRVFRVGPGIGGNPRSTRSGSTALGTGAGRSGVRRGAAGSQPGVTVGAALGVPSGGGAGWLAIGSGITTGPTDGVGMNGVLLSGSAVLPGVAEPALIAARIGIDAVPASSATVSR
ncbi:hypothetical protein [Micromonospora sp. NPDC050695]|uniref:hypothetical protein n=1 Tax=Micromonospora sp. NPDC050695 TaxID=3154938 RepID=UPI0033F2CE0E